VCRTVSSKIDANYSRNGGVIPSGQIRTPGTGMFQRFTQIQGKNFPPPLAMMPNNGITRMNSTCTAVSKMPTGGLAGSKKCPALIARNFRVKNY
jgi:hypothetical protein